MKKYKLVIVYAHPDDESFSLGGTLARYKKGDVETVLISATRGEAGIPGNPPICRSEELSEVRTTELQAAAKILGIKKIYFLGLRDGTLSRFSSRFLAQLIFPILEYEQPQVVVTFPETGVSGHDDHVVIHHAARRAYQQYQKASKTKSKLYYSTIPQSVVEALHQKGLVRQVFKRPFAGTPDHKITTIIDIRATYAVKLKALQCHRTQHQDWERYIKRKELGFADFEYYTLAFTNLSGQHENEKDLFEGF